MAQPILMDRVPFGTGSSRVPGPVQDLPRSPSVPRPGPLGYRDRVPFGTPNLSLELVTRTFHLHGRNKLRPRWKFVNARAAKIGKVEGKTSGGQP